jgi:hypothetical protein
MLRCRNVSENNDSYTNAYTKKLVNPMAPADEGVVHFKDLTQQVYSQ